MIRFSFKNIVNAQPCIDPLFQNTPQYESETLGAYFGCRVILKVETVNPIRSFKGRGAELLAHHTKEKQLMCASAGNFGQAMAWSCRKRSINLTVYAGLHANQFKVSRMKELGATVVQAGNDFDESKAIAREVASKKGIRFVEDSLDVETVIGAGTIGVELATSTPVPDVILVPLGNGALINGVAMATRSLMPKAKVVAIQSEDAPAMIESWKSGTVVTSENINTICDGIGVRIPVPDALAEMKELIHDGLLISEKSLLHAMRLLQSHAGLMVEPSAAVGLAAMLENRELFTGKTVALILTGSNLTDQQLQQWF